MAHSLILGMTESGKTTLSKRLARYYFGMGFAVIVLDPMNDPGWKPELKDPSDLELKYQIRKRFYQTDDPEKFLSVFWNARQAMVFIDEAGDAVGKYDVAMQQTATKGRHWGHCVHFLSQRGAQLSPTVRDQCGHLFLFTTSLRDSKIHSDEWNRPELLEAPQLKQGEYFHVTRYGVLERGSLFGESSNVRTNSDNRGNGSDNLGAEPAQAVSEGIGSGTDPGPTSD